MRKWLILCCALVMTALLDQASKAWALRNLPLGESAQPIAALAPFFQLTRGSNSGAAFGIFPMAGDFFLVAAPLIVAGLVWHFRGVAAEARFAPVGYGLVIGGALGNVLDRLQHGHVVDFIHYQLPDLISNVSNLADHGIVLGVGLLLAESFWRERRATAPSRPAPAE